MKKTMAAWTAMTLVLLPGSLLAHHSLAQFDTTTAVRIKGVVVRIEQLNPHSFVFVDQKGADGLIERWAIEGPTMTQLARRGISKDTIKVGDVIEACGYATKPGVESHFSVSTEPISLSLKATTPKSISGRLMDAEQLVMSDGRKLVWSDYGHHKCLGPEYRDFHVK